MACLEMYNTNNSDHKGSAAAIPTPPAAPALPPPPPMSPRISFSNEFAESSSGQHQQQQYHQQQTRESPPVSSDFEFSTAFSSTFHSSLPKSSSSRLTASADELFFKGRILPLKDNSLKLITSRSLTTTLRDELLAGDDDEDEDDAGGFSLKPPVLMMKGSNTNAGRWKGFLGLRKSHIIGSRKPADHHQVAASNPNLFDEPSSNSTSALFKGFLIQDPNQQLLPSSNYFTQRMMMCRGDGTATAIASGPGDNMKM